VLEYLTRTETASALSREVSRSVGRLAAENSPVAVGELLGIDGTRKARIDDIAGRAVIALLEERLPPIVRDLDVHGIALRAARASRKWVDAFGAAVGFLVGLVPAVLRVFGLS
jgi:hypothetical protein